MHDTFYEQIVRVQLTMKQHLLRMLTIVGPIILLYLFVIFVGFFGITLGIIAIYLSLRFLYPRFKLEYEYSIVEKEFSIAAIFNKANRKDYVTLDLAEVELIAPSDSPKLANYKNGTTKSYTSQTADAKTYTIVTYDKGNVCRYIIEPDEKMLHALQGQVASRMHMN